jgi:hypothetical protein
LLDERDEAFQLSPSGVVEDDSPEGDEGFMPEDDRRLDPMTRHLATPLAAQASFPPASVDGLQERLDLARTQTLEQIFPVLVRKAAWQFAADRRSATLRLEIGAGPFDGTTVLIRADLHEVHIELDAPPGIDLEAWKSRLRLRLASQGLIAMIS